MDDHSKICFKFIFVVANVLSIVVTVGATVAEMFKWEWLVLWATGMFLCTVGSTMQLIYFVRHFPIHTVGQSLIQLISIAVGGYHSIVMLLKVLSLCNPEYEPSITKKMTTVRAIVGLLLSVQVDEVLEAIRGVAKAIQDIYRIANNF